jgi:hypothetical protein
VWLSNEVANAALCMPAGRNQLCRYTTAGIAKAKFDFQSSSRRKKPLAAYFSDWCSSRTYFGCRRQLALPMEFLAPKDGVKSNRKPLTVADNEHNQLHSFCS